VSHSTRAAGAFFSKSSDLWPKDQKFGAIAKLTRASTGPQRDAVAAGQGLTGSPK